MSLLAQNVEFNFLTMPKISICTAEWGSWQSHSQIIGNFMCCCFSLLFCVLYIILRTEYWLASEEVISQAIWEPGCHVGGWNSKLVTNSLWAKFSFLGRVDDFILSHSTQLLLCVSTQMRKGNNSELLAVGDLWSPFSATHFLSCLSASTIYI